MKMGKKRFLNGSIVSILLYIFVTCLSCSVVNAQEISKEKIQEACREALCAIQPMNKEKLNVHIKNVVNVVDTVGELCGLFLGYEVDETSYGYAIYDIKQNDIKEFVFCDGIGNLFSDVECQWKSV